MDTTPADTLLKDIARLTPSQLKQISRKALAKEGRRQLKLLRQAITTQAAGRLNVDPASWRKQGRIKVNPLRGRLLITLLPGRNRRASYQPRHRGRAIPLALFADSPEKNRKTRAGKNRGRLPSLQAPTKHIATTQHTTAVNNLHHDITQAIYQTLGI